MLSQFFHIRSLFQVFKELNHPHPNKMSQLFLVCPHLCSWSQPKLGLQRLLPACVVPCAHLKRTLLFLVWHSSAYTYPGKCGLLSASTCPLGEVHFSGYKLFNSLSWPLAFLRQNGKIRKTLLWSLFFHTHFLFHCSSSSCCRVVPQPLTWGISSSYYWLLTFTQNCQSSFPGSWHFMFSYWQWVIMGPPITFKTLPISTLCACVKAEVR